MITAIHVDQSDFDSTDPGENALAVLDVETDGPFIYTIEADFNTHPNEWQLSEIMLALVDEFGIEHDYVEESYLTLGECPDWPTVLWDLLNVPVMSWFW